MATLSGGQDAGNDMTGPRVHVLVVPDGGKPVLLGSHDVTPNVPVAIGRESNIGVGIDPIDFGVSRRALVATSTGSAWRIELHNHNRADLQLWGQPSMPAQLVETLAWPRIAYHVRGKLPVRHWVLFDDPSLGFPDPPPRSPSLVTESVDRPAPLTDAERAAIRVMFGDLLAWPPRTPAVLLQLKQAGPRLGIVREGVARRLERARGKALALGLGRTVPVTDPEYLYVLVRAGYLPPTDEDLDPVLR